MSLLAGLTKALLRETDVSPCQAFRQLTASSLTHSSCFSEQDQSRRRLGTAHRGSRPLSSRRIIIAAAGQGAAQPGGSGSLEKEEGWREQGFMKALLLAWFASGHRSLFAAKCLVETVVELYREGYTLDDVKLALSLAGFSYGGKLLSPLQEDILLTWVAVVMMTLRTVGVPPYPEGTARLERRGSAELTESTSRMTMGLQMFVKQSLDMFLSGTDLYRLQLQQSMAGQLAGGVEGGPEVQGPSPAILILQQNTRLCIITLELIRALGLPTDIPLRQAPAPGSYDESSASEDELPGAQVAVAPLGYVRSFQARLLPGAAGVAGTAVGSVGAYAAGSSDDVSMQKRSAAVRLLIGFMGAASSWLYPAYDFIDSAADCYQLGWTADELFQQLKDEEFAQSGGVFPVGVAMQGGPERISASLYASWLSLVYITMVQMGVPHPGADEQLGWAWVCSLGEEGGSPFHAHGLADFVSATLRREGEKEAQGVAPGEDAGAAAAVAASAEDNPDAITAGPSPSGWRAEPVSAAAAAAANSSSMVAPGQAQEREGFVVVEDPSLVQTSGFALLLSQQISLVQMTRQRVLAALQREEVVVA